MTAEEIAIAKGSYRDFFRSHPGVRNPTDINCSEKWHFFADRSGWGTLSVMVKARKYHQSANGFPFPWTKPEYWEDGRDA